MRLYRSDAGWLEREKDIRADAVIVSMSPTKLSRHGCIPAEPAAVSPGKIIVPRIVIGGVILDQPAGGGIGAVAWGPLAGTLGFSKRSIMNECRLTIAVQKATVVIERVVFPLFQVS